MKRILGGAKLRRIFGWGIVSLLLLSGVPALSETKVVDRKVVPFSLSDVRLLPGSPFQQTQEGGRAYLLRLNPDRFLAHLRENAGLKPKAVHYGGWDEGGANTVGHYLSACAQMAAATGDPALKKRVAYLVSEMAACQATGGDGGLYAFRWDRNTWFARLKQGEVIKTNVNGIRRIRSLPVCEMLTPIAATSRQNRY